MKRDVFDKFTITYYDSRDVAENIYVSQDQNEEHERRYVLADVLTEDTAGIGKLREQGFLFHDRLLLAKIDLKRLQKNWYRLVRYDISEHHNISKELVELAVRSYPNDRRFHLDLKYDAELAEMVIRRYLRELSDENIDVYHCVHNGRVVGYTIIKEHSNGAAENLLGAVDAAYQSRGAAMSLYAGTLLSMKEKEYREYRGWISTKNAASLNLHAAFGARFTETRDRYVQVISR